MDFSVQVEGLDKLAQASARVQASVAKEIQSGVYLSAQHVRTEAIKSIKGGGKSGRVYTTYFLTNKKTGGIFPAGKRDKPHTASAPGQAPAADTGTLDGSISAYVNKLGAESVGIVVSRLKYANWLEFGTTKIKPRPFMVPAFEKSRAWIKERLARAVNDGIRKATK